MALARYASTMALAITLLVSLAPAPALAQAGAPSNDPAAAEADAARLRVIRTEFATRKALAYMAFAVALASGLWVFIYRRRRLMPLSRTAGAVTSVLVSVVLFALLAKLFTSADAASCASALLEIGARATDYDDICRAARESAANAFGFSTIFRYLFVPADPQYIQPIGAAMLTVLTYLSIPLAALVAFFIARPLAERYAVPA